MAEKKPVEGQPTEIKRGGVTGKDLNKEGAFAKPDESSKRSRPSITGNEGIPTEPKRGSLNKLERKLEGVKPAEKAEKAEKAKPAKKPTTKKATTKKA